MDFDDSYGRWKAWDSPFTYSPAEAAYFTGEFAGLSLAGKAVLEIGFGRGSFLAWAAAQGASVMGVEVSSVLVAEGRKQGYEVSLPDDLSADPATKVDLIVALDVFEHLTIDQTTDYLRLMARSLKADGRVLLRFPNGASPFGRVHQYGDMFHIQVLSAQKLEQYLSMFEVPLRILQVRDPFFAASPGRGAAYRLGKLLQRAVRRLLFASLSAIVGLPRQLDANVIIVLAKAPP